MSPNDITEQLNKIEEDKPFDQKQKEAEIIRKLKYLQFRAIRQENKRINGDKYGENDEKKFS